MYCERSGEWTFPFPSGDASRDGREVAGLASKLEGFDAQSTKFHRGPEDFLTHGGLI